MIYIFSLLINPNVKKNLVGDSHVGVLIYVKDNIHHRRRHDIEILKLENIWIELSFKHKRVLFNLFHRLSNIVVTALKALPIGKARGPDGINNCTLRELAHELSSPLCSLFNQSLILCIVQDIWKEAHVCHIQKGGDRTAISNYCPIFLLSNINKVLARIVFKHLYNHFLENDILAPLQSGFIPGDSTVNQQFFPYNAFCKVLDAGKEVQVIFCDISKVLHIY